jgi:hypothetical protein
MMSEGALTRCFDLVRGEWRINASRPGYKVVGCAIEGLRHRPFPLRQVELSEFTALVPFDGKNGEPKEPAVVLRGMPTLYYYYGNTVYIYPPPLHAWRLKLIYLPREETRTATPWASSPGTDEHHARPIARPARRAASPALRGTQGVWGRDTHA